MRQNLIHDRRIRVSDPLAARSETGGFLTGCALVCSILILLTLVGLFLFLSWVFGPTEIPDPQSAMLPNSQSFAVVRLDSKNKAIVNLLGKVADGSASLYQGEKAPLPRLVRWLVGGDPATIVRKFLPVQLVYSDAPTGPAGQVAIVLSPGRGKGIFAFVSRAIASQAAKGAESVPYQNNVILCKKGEGDKPPSWITVKETSLCLSNSADGVKQIMDTLAPKPPSAPSNIVALYPTLREGAIICGASADMGRMQQVVAWLVPKEEAAPPLRLQRIRLATFKLTLSEETTVHAAIEVMCTDVQVAREMQKSIQVALTPVQLRKQITGVRVIQQEEKLYMDLDVLDVDRLIVRALEQKRNEAKK